MVTLCFKLKVIPQNYRVSAMFHAYILTHNMCVCVCECVLVCQYMCIVSPGMMGIVFLHPFDNTSNYIGSG
jgi:hypothetical protein